LVNCCDKIQLNRNPLFHCFVMSDLKVQETYRGTSCKYCKLRLIFYELLFFKENLVRTARVQSMFQFFTSDHGVATELLRSPLHGPFRSAETVPSYQSQNFIQNMQFSY
jgi:hypothetical protein